jgi:hypothetical protein
MLRTKDYDVAVTTLVSDPLVILMAHEIAPVFNPKHLWDYSFISGALRTYLVRDGKNQDAAKHHIGAVAEAIRKINGWV